MHTDYTYYHLNNFVPGRAIEGRPLRALTSSSFHLYILVQAVVLHVLLRNNM